MDIVIVKGVFSDSNWNNAPYIAFIIKGNVINVEEIDWSIPVTSLFVSEPSR